MPPFPRPSRSTSSRAAYLRRNLENARQAPDQHMATRNRDLVTRWTQAGTKKKLRETHHPPGSAAAASWASLTLGSSRPFRDMVPRAAQAGRGSVVRCIELPGLLGRTDILVPGNGRARASARGAVGCGAQRLMRHGGDRGRREGGAAAWEMGVCRSRGGIRALREEHV